MIHFEGEKNFAVPLTEVAAKLSDAGFLVGSLPDVTLGETSPDRAVWKMRPGFSFIRTTLETTLTVESRSETASLLKIVSTGIGASSTVEVRMAFQATETGTTVKWTGDIVGLTGLLKLAPKGLIQSSAGKVINETWTAVEKRLLTGERGASAP